MAKAIIIRKLTSTDKIYFFIMLPKILIKFKLNPFKLVLKSAIMVFSSFIPQTSCFSQFYMKLFFWIWFIVRIFLLSACITFFCCRAEFNSSVHAFRTAIKVLSGFIFNFNKNPPSSVPIRRLLECWITQDRSENIKSKFAKLSKSSKYNVLFFFLNLLSI